MIPNLTGRSVLHRLLPGLTAVCGMFASGQLHAQTIMLDIQAQNGPMSTPSVDSEVSDFQAYDDQAAGELDGEYGTEARSVTTWGGLQGLELYGENDELFTVSTAGNPTWEWATQNGWTANLPILHGYSYEEDDAPSVNTVTITGLTAYPAGHLVRLTVFAIGDGENQNSIVTPTYGGGEGEPTTVLPAKTSLYGPDQENSIPALQWEFFADGTTDTLSFTWGAAGTPTTGLNGFMLSGAAPSLGPVTSVTLTPATSTVLVDGDDVQLTTTADFEGGSDLDVTSSAVYMSSNPAVATVNSSGAVTPLSNGSTTITSTVTGATGPSMNDTAVVNVEDIVTINLTAGEDFLFTNGFQTTITATASSASLTDVPLNDMANVVFMSNAPGSADVDAVGVVTPGATEGVATITVELGLASETIDVGVEEPTSISGAMIPDNMLIVDGFSSPIEVSASSANITDRVISPLGGFTFTSNNETFGTVDEDGNVTPGSTIGGSSIDVDFRALTTDVPFTVGELAPKPTNLRHRYSFNGTNDESGETPVPASLVVPDSANGADGMIVSTGGLYNPAGNEFITPGGGANGPAAYVDLPNGIISAMTGAATFELWASRSSSNDWERFFDFGSSQQGEDASGTGDKYIVLVAQNGNDGNIHTSFTLNRDFDESPDIDGGLTTGISKRHYVVTYDPDEGIMNLYVDGVLTDSGQININRALSELNDVNNWLGRSQWNNPRIGASYDEFRIYEGTMSASEVVASMAAGPDANIDFTPLPSDEPILVVSTEYDSSVPSFAVTFESEIGKSYQVSVSNDLGGFDPVGDPITATGTTTTYTDTTVNGVTERFYKVDRID